MGRGRKRGRSGNARGGKGGQRVSRGVEGGVRSNSGRRAGCEGGRQNGSALIMDWGMGQMAAYRGSSSRTRSEVIGASYWRPSSNWTAMSVPLAPDLRPAAPMISQMYACPSCHRHTQREPRRSSLVAAATPDSAACRSETHSFDAVPPPPPPRLLSSANAASAPVSASHSMLTWPYGSRDVARAGQKKLLPPRRAKTRSPTMAAQRAHCHESHGADEDDAPSLTSAAAPAVEASAAASEAAELAENLEGVSAALARAAAGGGESLNASAPPPGVGIPALRLRPPALGFAICGFPMHASWHRRPQPPMHGRKAPAAVDASP